MLKILANYNPWPGAGKDGEDLFCCLIVGVWKKMIFVPSKSHLCLVGESDKNLVLHKHK